jgi:hypothetical protein
MELPRPFSLEALLDCDRVDGQPFPIVVTSGLPNFQELSGGLELTNAEVGGLVNQAVRTRSSSVPRSVISTQLPAHVDATWFPVARRGAS